MTVQFVRVYFLESFTHVVNETSKVVYQAKHFYHLTEEHAAELVAKGIVKLEEELEKEAAAAAAAAAEDEEKIEKTPAPVADKVDAEE